MTATSDYKQHLADYRNLIINFDDSYYWMLSLGFIENFESYLKR